MWLCHFPEVPAPLVDVAYWGKTGRHLLAMSSSHFGPDSDIGRRRKRRLDSERFIIRSAPGTCPASCDRLL